MAYKVSKEKIEEFFKTLGEGDFNRWLIINYDKPMSDKQVIKACEIISKISYKIKTKCTDGKGKYLSVMLSEKDLPLQFRYQSLLEDRNYYRDKYFKIMNTIKEIDEE